MTKHERRQKLSRKLCKLMGWEFKNCHVYAALRKAAMAEAVVIGMDKLEEIIKRLEKA